MALARLGASCSNLSRSSLQSRSHRPYHGRQYPQACRRALRGSDHLSSPTVPSPPLQPHVAPPAVPCPRLTCSCHRPVHARVSAQPHGSLSTSFGLCPDHPQNVATFPPISGTPTPFRVFLWRTHYHLTPSDRLFTHTFVNCLPSSSGHKLPEGRGSVLLPTAPPVGEECRTLSRCSVITHHASFHSQSSKTT